MAVRKKQPESRERLKPKKIEDLIRHFILDHSEELFIAKGYQKTSMDMIARACGLSKPTLYNYFHGKHEIFTRLYQRLFKGLNDKIKALLAQGGDKQQVLLAIIDQYFFWLYTKKDFLQMYFREQHLVIHEDIKEHMDWHISSKKEMVGLLAKALDGNVRPEVKKKYSLDVVAATLFSILDGLISDPMLKDADEFSEQKKFVAELFRQGVLTREK
jgi:AcrR family transcriptional regulator